MSKHRKRHKQRHEQFFDEIVYEPSREIILDTNKFVLIKENEGIYCIYNISKSAKVLIKKFADDNDEYAMNCAAEVLDYLIQDI